MSVTVLATKLKFEPLRSLAFGSIGATYTAVGTPTEHPMRQFFIQNLTDQLLIFSFDGINDHFVLPVNGFWIEDITTNKSQDIGFYIAQNTTLYVKRSAGAATSGSVYFTVTYGANQ